VCFVLYAGTSNPLPRKKWQKDAPGLSVESLTERDAPIKAHFRSPEVQYIGSTSRCGCDFPHATLQKGEWPEIEYLEHLERDAERVAINKGNREALVDLLRESGEKAIELYGVWDGDFVDAPRIQESITAETILDSGFLFKERGFYSVAVERANEARRSR
jgi:hypothetical protein